MKFSAQWAYGNISDGLYTVMAIPSLVLFCDHFVAHIIKYNLQGKDMVKVEKISPQQAQSQLQLLNAIAMMIIIIKGKKQSTSNK